MFLWGEEILRFELTPLDGGRCHLVFVNTFDDGGKAARDGAGGHLCLDALDERLQGSEPDPTSSGLDRSTPSAGAGGRR